MTFLHNILDLVLHLDVHLVNFVALYGIWVYALLFIIIFSETALIFMAFLPGDSLLFATGALAAKSDNTLNINLLFILLLAASILGNNLNYLIGKFIGPKIFHSKQSWLFNKKHLESTHRFYETYGGKAIILARFMPIVRTFAPFVAGIGYMNYRHFFFYNTIGGLIWIASMLYISFLFGNLPFVKDHFSTIVLAIIAISILPAVIGILRNTYCKTSA